MNTRESVEKVVIDALDEFGFDRQDILLDSSLADLDVSSLDLVELIQIVREEFGIELQGQQIAGCATLDALISLITDHAQAAGAA